MDPFILFGAMAAIICTGLGVALYLDCRTRQRVRSGALPVGVFLLGWWQPGVNPFVLFSPTFLRTQHGAQWAVWLLRLIMIANLAGLGCLVWWIVSG